tara:strand:+ start:361 stop:534 length:174 start_codon:yes stop_codon:yes gene_type:complete
MSNLNNVVARISALRVLAAFAVMGNPMEEVAAAGNVSVDEAYEIIRADERRKAVEAR